MPRNNVCIIIFLICIPAFAFSWGAAEESAKPEKNEEWILCVTNFNISALPQSQQIIGEVMTKSLVSNLDTVDHRIRLSPEYGYYEGYAWSQARAAAAKALAAKRNERDLLLYRGEPGWKYQSTLKTINADILKLEENLRLVNEEAPLIAGEPVFKLTAANISGTFPEPPRAGGEYRFCRTQNADAFLSGEVTEFHGRIYITMRLYVLYANAYIYEDEIIFSPDAANGAVEELAGRLIAALSGSSPAAIVVHADPPETLVLINKTFAGRGELGLQERPPGTILVDLSAENYFPQSAEVVLSSGELTEIDVTLQRQPLTETEIHISGENDAAIYQGALYIGEAPLTLRLPANLLDYINVESSNGKIASVVFTTPDLFGDKEELTLKLKTPLPKGQKRVEKARSRAYWAWGSTWITGVAAWMINGLYTSQMDGYMRGIDIGTDAMYNSANILYWVNYGSIALVIAAAGYDFIQMLRYMYSSGADATPIARQ
jgi:hypothetical protein